MPLGKASVGSASAGRPEEPLVPVPIAVFVALHLAHELRAAGSQASDDGVDVVDCECDMADARGVRGACRWPPRPDGA